MKKIGLLAAGSLAYAATISCTAGVQGYSAGQAVRPTAGPEETSAIAIKAAMQQGPDGSSCVIENGTLRFIGSTDALEKCVNSGMFETLVITSPGGSVAKAIPAAFAVADKHVRVEVLGLCASSCANYIVPAAESLVVRPFSALIVHGGANSDEAQTRAASEAAAKSAGVPDEILPKVIEQGVQQMQKLRKQQDAFRQQFNVRSFWYDIPFFFAKVRDGSAPGAPLVSKHFLKACMPDMHVDQFWSPRNKAELERLTSLLGGGALWDLRTEPAARFCGD